MSEETKSAAEQEQPEVGPEADAPEPQAPEVAEDAPAEDDEDTGDGLPDNTVTIEDAGTLRKQVSIEVSRQRIDAKFDEMFGELRRSAQVPGFRVGRAPRKLIEKRFGKEVSEDVRNNLVAESIGKALEDAGFKALGEPELTLDEIELPDEGELTFSFEVEVAPEFDLPEYKGLAVTRPVVEITDERVQEAIDTFRRRLARLKPVDEPAAEGDFVVAEVSLKGEGIDQTIPNAELRVAPGMVEGIPLEDLPKALIGKAAGEQAELTAKVPAGHPNEDWREKDVTISFEVKDVKRLELPELTDELAALAGAASADEMRETTRAQLESRVSVEQQRAMRDQICSTLMEKTDFEVPPQAAERSAVRLLQRRCINLMMQGVPREEIERNMDQLELEARQQAGVQMKLTFILGKLADAEGIEVDEGEVNSRIAEIARSQNRRPERLRHELREDGTLETLAVTMREEKAIDKVLELGKITDAKPGDEEEKAKPKSKAKKKTAAKKPSAKKPAGGTKAKDETPEEKA